MVKLREVFPHGTGFVLVFEFMLSDLSEVIRSSLVPLTEAQVKSYMLMLLKGIAYCHDNSIMHRVSIIVFVKNTIWNQHLASFFSSVDPKMDKCWAMIHTFQKFNYWLKPFCFVFLQFWSAISKCFFIILLSICPCLLYSFLCYILVSHRILNLPICWSVRQGILKLLILVSPGCLVTMKAGSIVIK